MLSSMPQLVDDSHMDDDFFTAMDSAPWPSPPCCRWRNLPSSLPFSVVVEPLDNDGDSDLDKQGSDTKCWDCLDLNYILYTLHSRSICMHTYIGGKKKKLT
ncbi:unnamed protein product [Cuscuta epithymum]|uniref:Uncharacterized protein n=1 Tax=Cuscuta epithymum TaxID=186058 RepID=A0AAV0DH94_9ASTE|nr:unnamed protein product [Cuscuta epithymum]CAH9124218.1 unnamed protein product [Cuscuta epithymum]